MRQALAEQPAVIRVATYERVSSDDQRERETIQSQRDVLDQFLHTATNVELAGRYVDDGVSGTVPFALRPAGARLLKAAAKDSFDEVWVYRIDRLGRDDVDPLVVWQTLERLGVKVRSVYEGYTDQFMYSIHVAVAFGAVVILALVFGPWLYVTATVAVAVAWSRLVLRAHTAAQVIGGAIVGAFVAGAVFIVLTR